MTNKYKKLYILFAILSFLCFAGPALFFTMTAFVTGTAVASKIALSSTVLIVIILSIVAAANKIAMRSRLWILLIGLFICLNSVIVIVFTIGFCQVLDELIFTPLKNHYKTKYTINKEIDKRL